MGTAVPLRVRAALPLASKLPDAGSWVKVRVAGPVWCEVGGLTGL